MFAGFAGCEMVLEKRLADDVEPPGAIACRVIVRSFAQFATFGRQLLCICLDDSHARCSLVARALVLKADTLS